MPGHNHYPNCNCGWCETRRASTKPIKYEPPRYFVERPDSLTIPNATCPVCKSTVFFYQNSYGSRVFFDSLGHPWPKHECTDTSPIANIKSRRQKLDNDTSTARQTLQPTVRSRGNAPESRPWIAISFLKRKAEDDWIVLYFEVVDSKALIRILTDADVRLSQDMPIFFRSWDEDEQTVIEYLDNDLVPSRINGWKYGRWYAHTASECVDALNTSKSATSK